MNSTLPDVFTLLSHEEKQIIPPLSICYVTKEVPRSILKQRQP